jgi:hypothetical protein
MGGREFKKLAFLGIASGLIAISSDSTHAEGASIDANSMQQYLLAKPACKGANGCGGFTASRDLTGNMEEENLEDGENEEEEDSSSKTNKKKNVDEEKSIKASSKEAVGSESKKNSSFRSNSSNKIS